MSSFEKIGVVGAGMMGSEIALMFALAGYPTLLSDASQEVAERAVARLHDGERQMVAAGYDGSKAGRGWHRYGSDGKRQ